MEYERIAYFSNKVERDTENLRAVDCKYLDKIKKQVFELCETPKSLQKFYSLRGDIKSFSYLCPNCAVELKGEWVYVWAWHDDDFSKKPGYQKGYNQITSALESTHEHNQKVSEEMHRFCDLENCPFCGAKYQKTFPFFDCSSWKVGIGKGGYTMSIPYEMTWSRDLKWRDAFERTHPENLSHRDDRAKNISYDKYKNVVREEEIKKVFTDPTLKACADYIQSCDTPYPAKTLKAEKNTEFLKEYLHNLINLETNILCMSKRLNELYLLRRENDGKVVYEQGLPIFDLSKKINQKNTALLDLKQEKQKFEKQPITFQTVAYPPKPIKPEMLKANIFNKRKIEALNAQAEAMYQDAEKRYYVAVEKCNEQTEKNKLEAEHQKLEKIKTYSEEIETIASYLIAAQEKLERKKETASSTPTPAVGEKHIIDTEITSLEEALKKNFQCRNELYSYNVIFDKYRNIVAISSFYEYLMAGRCDSLEGVDGAYNIYENESRMDSILTKLDEIETKLDEIKANQFMIYNKLNDIQSSLYSLNYTMEKAVSSLESINTNTSSMNKYLENISKNADVIAHNTAVSAYYSKVNAELTNALGFMVALK